MHPVGTDLPDPHIFGDVVLEHEFDRPLGRTMSVYSRVSRPVELLRAQLRAHPGQSLVVNSIRSFSANFDYWILDHVGGTVTTLSDDRPLNRMFIIEQEFDPADIARLAHNLMSWSWERVQTDSAELMAAARARSARYPEEFEIEAMSLGYRGAVDLLEKLAKALA